MSSLNIDVAQVPEKWPELLMAMDTGKEVILVDAEGRKAKLVSLPVTRKGPRIPGLQRGKFKIADDFDAELPDSFWLGEE